MFKFCLSNFQISLSALRDAFAEASPMNQVHGGNDHHVHRESHRVPGGNLLNCLVLIFSKNNLISVLIVPDS